MELIRSFFDASPIAVLFVCVAIGFAIGRIRVAGIPLGGIPGTLFAAIVVGQVGVEVDENIKTMAFALFIYSLGYVSGPSFFQSLALRRVGRHEQSLALAQAAACVLQQVLVGRMMHGIHGVPLSRTRLCRNCMAARMRDFTVPTGMLSRWAISVALSWAK